MQTYFSDEKNAIDKLEAQKEAITQRRRSHLEHSGEEGLLEDAKNNKGKLQKIASRIELKKLKITRTLKTKYS